MNRDAQKSSAAGSHRQIDLIETVCARDPGERGIGRLAEHAKGGLLAAARSIAEHPKPHVAIMTGFWIAHGLPPSPENDGPPGAAHIAAALHAAGIPCRLVTDTLCAYAVRAAAGGAGLPSDFPLDVVSLNGRGGENGDSIDAVRSRWQGLEPTVSHVVSIERCGPRADGKIFNARGVDITAVTAPLQDLFANGAWTKIGIGDGGNELGMGSLPHDLIVRHVRNGDQVACVVPCDHLIVCGVSNWGGYALPAALALLRPDLRGGLTSRLTREWDLRILEHAVFKGRAIQGATGTPVLSVDKFPWPVQAGLLDEILCLLDQEDHRDSAPPRESRR